jgi:uncharacterized protein (DUF488 family)
MINSSSSEDALTKQAGRIVVYTIGHSTRSFDEFVALLQNFGLHTLADIRTVPRSRHVPQFNRDTLETALPKAGIQYVHLAKLGGLRHGLGARSVNTGWRNASFRGFADYMETEEFAAGIDELMSLASEETVAIMCAEAVPWRCHRSLVADALTVRGVAVCHITSAQRCRPHQLTPFAKVAGERISYPGALP